MAEGKSSSSDHTKSKHGIMKIFGFGKKKKKRSSEVSRENCPLCAAKNANLNDSRCTIEVYEQKQRMLRSESARREPSFQEFPIKPPVVQEEEVVVVCKCTRCRRARGEDPLTVELLPMDAQVTLQNSILQSSLQDAGFMCVII